MTVGAALDGDDGSAETRSRAAIQRFCDPLYLVSVISDPESAHILQMIRGDLAEDRVALRRAGGTAFSAFLAVWLRSAREALPFVGSMIASALRLDWLFRPRPRSTNQFALSEFLRGGKGLFGFGAWSAILCCFVILLCVDLLLAGVALRGSITRTHDPATEVQSFLSTLHLTSLSGGWLDAIKVESAVNAGVALSAIVPMLLISRAGIAPRVYQFVALLIGLLVAKSLLVGMQAEFAGALPVSPIHIVWIGVPVLFLLFWDRADALWRQGAALYRHGVCNLVLIAVAAAVYVFAHRSALDGLRGSSSEIVERSWLWWIRSISTHLVVWTCLFAATEFHGIWGDRKFGKDVKQVPPSGGIDVYTMSMYDVRGMRTATAGSRATAVGILAATCAFVGFFVILVRRG